MTTPRKLCPREIGLLILEAEAWRDGKAAGGNASLIEAAVAAIPALRAWHGAAPPVPQGEPNNGSVDERMKSPDVGKPEGPDTRGFAGSNPAAAAIPQEPLVPELNALGLGLGATKAGLFMFRAAAEITRLQQEVAAERERCARICDADVEFWQTRSGTVAAARENMAREIAAAIRKG